MNILIACEESQRVTEYMRAQGHNAYSCDLYDSSHEDTSLHQYHLQGCLFYHFDNPPKSVESWDMVVAFPPCTYLTTSGNRWMDHPRFPNRQNDRLDALNFVKRIWALDCPKIAIENPVGVLSTQWRKPDQYVQPYEYGHTISKKTCRGWKFGLDTPADTEPLSEEPAALLYEEDSASFYELFPQVLKEFYEPQLRAKYLDKCITNIFLNIPIFNTHRMIAEYTRNYDLILAPQVSKKIKNLQKLYQSEI